MAKQALGRGLSALIQTRVANPTPVEELGEHIHKLTLDQIVSSPFQPRKDFPEDQLSELVESIRAQGIIQPIIVRKVAAAYELIAGERRWRAARQAGLKDIPAIVRHASDREALEHALIENLQREDLNAIEEAAAYSRMAKEFSLTQEDIAQRVGKKRATIANALRLLELSEEIQGFLKQGLISVGHAKVLLSVKSHDEQKVLAQQIIRQGLSVRRAEKIAAEQLAKNNPGISKPKFSVSTAPAILHLQNLLTHRLSTRVVIHHGAKKGAIQIEYYGDDDLNRLLSVLGLENEQ